MTRVIDSYTRVLPCDLSDYEVRKKSKRVCVCVCVNERIYLQWVLVWPVVNRFLPTIRYNVLVIRASKGGCETTLSRTVDVFSLFYHGDCGHVR